MSAPRSILGRAIGLRVTVVDAPLCAVCLRPVPERLRRVKYCSHACVKKAAYRRRHHLPIENSQQIQKERTRYRVHQTSRYFIVQRREPDRLGFSGNESWTSISRWPSKEQAVTAKRELEGSIR